MDILNFLYQKDFLAKTQKSLGLRLKQIKKEKSKIKALVNSKFLP